MCVREKERDIEAHNVTAYFKTLQYKNDTIKSHELGYKASYILIGLGQLPFDIFTKMS